MLDNGEVMTLVTGQIREILLEYAPDEVTVGPGDTLYELGLDSLMLARLIVQLERALGVEPFTSGDAVVSDLRTVADVAGACRRTAHGAPAEASAGT